MPSLTRTAWALFLIDALFFVAFAVGAVTEHDPLGRAIALGLSELAFLPLVALGVLLGFSTWRHSATGLRVGVLLAACPILWAGTQFIVYRMFE